MKPILPRALHKDESKTTKHSSSVFVTHGGEEGILKNFENSRYQQNANEETSRRNQRFNGETRAYETNRSERESQTNMSMVTRLGGAQKKSPRKKSNNSTLSVAERSRKHKNSFPGSMSRGIQRAKSMLPGPAEAQTRL